MEIGKLRDAVQEILQPAGIAIDGSGPSDMHVNDERFFRRVLRDGSIGLGEAFMDGWWECDHLDDFFCKLMPLRPENIIRNNLRIQITILKAVFFNLASRVRAFTVGQRHYNLGNELFKRMLDRRMVYSCGLWRDARNLDEAQEAKLDLICRKLGLQPGDRVLDIGCGWGSFAGYAADRYKVQVVGITVSEEQVKLAREFCMGLPVEIRLQDYRDINERFDHIVSIGMFEHVCYKNYRTYMEVVRRCLRENGLFLLHTIGDSCSHVTVDPWFGKYIFPNSMIPSMKQISEAVENLFIIEDFHNIGADYDPTLMSWYNNFERNWSDLSGIYDERFYRMWKYYLLCSAGTFRSRCLQVWQAILSKIGVPRGYVPVR